MLRYARIVFCALACCLFAHCHSPVQKLGIAETSAVEDLMREHGVLDRLLLIYEYTLDHSLLPQAQSCLYRAASLMKAFIEEYHEKLEETYLFSRLEEIGLLLDLVTTLKKQHAEGRALTDILLEQTNPCRQMSSTQWKKIELAIHACIALMRPHMAREDTLLFPTFKTTLTQKEYDEMGDLFEKKEQELFGNEGFQTVVQLVSTIEKDLGMSFP